MKELLTITTHKGLLQYNRLAFGVAWVPAIWQRTIEMILQGIPKVQYLLDDIIVAGESEEEHLKFLDRVMERLDQCNLTINKGKCRFFQMELDFCGYRIDSKGLHKTQEKIRAIVEAPKPTNLTELHSFLGMVNYYHRFLPNLATTLAPMDALVQVKTPWRLIKQCGTAVSP